MANNFFSRFKTVEYNMDEDGSLLTLTNFVANVDVDDFFANHSASYTYYDIVDGERPDIISYKLYGSPDYHWTFFVINNDLRIGLNSAWPLSSNQFERMLEREYDKYSAISFMPQDDEDIDAVGVSGLFQLTRLSETYLPYLRLMNESGSDWAKILKYDNILLQAIIYDIEKTDGSGLSSSLDVYLTSLTYKMSWANPFESDTAEYDACEALRLEFIDSVIEAYSEFDPSSVIDESIFDELPSQEAIETAILETKMSYVFGKRFTPAPQVYRWASYRNAASEFYREDDDGNMISVAAFDVLSDANIITPKYISNFEKEEIVNSKKEKIRVIRKDRITDFVNTYFNTLNS